jgi:hypothetical protein
MLRISCRRAFPSAGKDEGVRTFARERAQHYQWAVIRD